MRDNTLDLGLQLLLQGTQAVTSTRTTEAQIANQGAQQQAPIVQQQRAAAQQSQQFNQQLQATQESEQARLQQSQQQFEQGQDFAAEQNQRARDANIEAEADRRLYERITQLEGNLAYVTDPAIRAEALAAIEGLRSAQALTGQARLDAANIPTYTRPDGTIGNASEVSGILNANALQYTYNLDQEQAALAAANNTLNSIIAGSEFDSSENSQDTRNRLANLQALDSTPQLIKDQIAVYLNTQGKIAPNLLVQQNAANAQITTDQSTITGVQSRIATKTESYEVRQAEIGVERSEAELSNVIAQGVSIENANNLSDFEYQYLLDTRDIMIESDRVGLMSQNLALEGQKSDNRLRVLQGDAQESANNENLMTFESRVALANKQNANGLELSDQEVRMGALTYKIGENQYAIGMVNLDAAQVAVKRDKLAYDVESYTSSKDYIADAIQSGDVQQLEKLLINMSNEGVFPELDIITASMTPEQVQDAITKARTSDYIFQNSQKLALKEIETAYFSQDIQRVSVKADLLGQLATVYSGEEVAQLMQTDPVLKDLYAQGIITNADVAAAQNLSNIQSKLRQQTVDAPAIEALKSVVLQQYSQPPEAGNEVAYAQGLRNALNEYATKTGLSQNVVEQIYSGYVKSWQNQDTVFDAELAQLQAQTLLTGAQAGLARANATKTSSTGTANSWGLTADEGRELNLVMEGLDAKTSAIEAAMRNAGCGDSAPASAVQANRMPDNSAVCANYNNQLMQVADSKIYSLEAYGINSPIPSTAGAADDALVDWTATRVPFLIEHYTAQGYTPQEAEQAAYETAVREGSRALQEGGYNFGAAGLNQVTETFGQFANQTPVTVPVPDVPSSLPVNPVGSPQTQPTNNEPTGNKRLDGTILGDILDRLPWNQQ